MRKGDKHNWGYRTKKYRSNKKGFTMFQSKKRKRSAPKGSGMPVGSKLHWGIIATEKRIPTKKGTIIILKGIKRQKGFTLNKKSRYIRPRKRR